ncbi:MAG: hypothetical protein RL498_547, partial [Pseudomonadota bacterium]
HKVAVNGNFEVAGTLGGDQHTLIRFLYVIWTPASP